MKPKAPNRIRDDLAPKGRDLLKLIVDRLADPHFVPGDPSTYLGYKECCVALGVDSEDGDVPWARLLQLNGLNDLNDWTQRHNLPRITGLIVNQSGERKYRPGGDYFASNGHPDNDWEWWEQQADDASKLDWRPFL